MISPKNLPFSAKTFPSIAVKKIGYLTVLLLLSFSAFPQKQPNILHWKTDVSLNTYLVQQMHQQYDARSIEFDKAIASKTNTLAYIKTIKQKFKTVLGKFPAKAALKPEITGVIDKQTYHIEKLVYQSFENHHVTANLYLPKGKGKFPSVLFFCGHEDLAKATESYQQTAILFAKNGFVVLVIDPISQSERVQLTDPRGKALTRGSTTEHTLLNLSSNLLGTSAAAYELFDNVRGLDYLVSRPEVDIDKIGCIGNSGGAMQAIYLAAFDERIKIIAPCSYLTKRERTLELTGAADGCAQIPNEGTAHLEMSDYLIAAAPKPTLVLAGRYDFIDYNGTLQAVGDLRKVYQTLNAPEKIKLFAYDDGHGISKPKREAAVQWFRKWFYHDPAPIKEENITALTDQELFASPKGKVSASYPSEVTIVEQNALLFKEKESLRKIFAQQSINERKQKVRDILGMKNRSGHLESEVISKIKASNHITFTNVILRNENEIPFPVRIYSPEKTVKKIVIWIGDDPNKMDSVRAEYISKPNEDMVILADVRGTGETTDKAELNDPKYFSKDYRNALLALHIGKPLVGQRATDLLNLIAFIQDDPKLKDLPITVNTFGLIGIPALHAAFLNPKISKVNLYQCISSYQDILNQQLAKDRYGAVIPNVLSYYDLPDLIKWIGPNKISFY